MSERSRLISVLYTQDPPRKLWRRGVIVRMERRAAIALGILLREAVRNAFRHAYNPTSFHFRIRDHAKASIRESLQRDAPATTVWLECVSAPNASLLPYPARRRRADEPRY
jgi:two-component sensor histidine kinase